MPCDSNRKDKTRETIKISVVAHVGGRIGREQRMFGANAQCDIMVILCDIMRHDTIEIVLVTQLCPTLCDSLDCGLPGSSVRGIL